VTAISESLAEQQKRIARAAERAGRDPASVRLIAVSKTKPASLIREAYEAGQRDFGENYVQELVKKADELRDLPDLRFHLIGHLQRNKVKQVAGLVSAVHSVDSVRLAHELGKRAESERAGKKLQVLVEVNVGGEESKSGASEAELDEVLAAVESAPLLELRGLMTVPPITEDPEGSRPYFEHLARLRDERGGAARLPELSIGMSHDLEVAIACGATYVRVGTAIFGARDARST
jgi:pyridoxal phosphate enzyme (YggS family)